MKFSIVTISFNQVGFLERAICSVVEQQGVDLEYIVVDPGSTDGSRALIERYRDRIQHVVLEPDAGPADGLNRGFALATGDLLGFVNADDELLPGALAKVEAAFGRDPAVEVVCGCGRAVDSSGQRIGGLVPSRFTPWLYVFGAVTVFQPGTFFRAGLFRKVGGFNAANETCWDGELFLDMAMAGGRFAIIGDDLALFRLHPASITVSGRLGERHERDAERLFQKVMGRRRGPLDLGVAMLARGVKWIRTPSYLLRRAARLR